MSSETKCIGPLLKVLYSKADVVFSSNVSALIDTKDSKRISRIISSTNGDDIFQQMEKSLIDKCKKSADLYAIGYVNSMKEKHGNSVLYKMLAAIYSKKRPSNSLRTRKLNYADNLINVERQRINDNMDSIKEFINAKDETITTMIERMKKECGVGENKLEVSTVENIVPVGDIKLDNYTNTINLINSVYMNTYIAHMFKSNIMAIYERIKYCIDEDCKIQPVPGIINRNSGRIDAVNSIQTHGLMDF